MTNDPNDVLNTIMDGMKAAGVAIDAEAQLPNLGMALFHLATTPGTSDRGYDAVAKLRNVVAEQRELAKTDPELGMRRLASALNLLGATLQSLGRPGEALEVIQEVVVIRRELAKADPAEFRPNLASALSNLGCLLHEFGRQDEGIAAMAESVAIQRTLVEESPDTARPQLATMLYNFGVLMSGSGRWHDALPVMREAVEMQRVLVETNPDLLPNLAIALNSLAQCLTKLGHRVEAATFKREAAAVWTKVATVTPELLSSDVADAAHDLAKRVTKSTRFKRWGKR